MDYDFSVLAKVVQDVKEALNLIVQAFMIEFEKIKPYMLKLLERLQEIEYTEKVKFKPVLEIKPTKTYYRNKRISNYYCRNNC